MFNKLLRRLRGPEGEPPPSLPPVEEEVEEEPDPNKKNTAYALDWLVANNVVRVHMAPINELPRHNCP